MSIQVYDPVQPDSGASHRQDVLYKSGHAWEHHSSSIGEEVGAAASTRAGVCTFFSKGPISLSSCRRTNEYGPDRPSRDPAAVR